MVVGNVDEVRMQCSATSDIQLLEVAASSHQFSECKFTFSNLGQVYWFCKFLDDAKTQSAESKLVLCTGVDAETITACSLLVGGYLILQEGATLEHVITLFEPIASDAFPDPLQTMSVGEGLTTADGWRALHRAKTNGWLNFQVDEVDIDSCIDMHEYQHYDNPLNGFLHVIIPSQLIAFSTPSNLSELSAGGSNAPWLDVKGRRFFSAEFYADILGGDFGVEVVVAFDRGESGAGDAWVFEDGSDDEEAAGRQVAAASSGYDESAFAGRGMAVERLGVSRYDDGLPSGALLRDVDRFLTLARLAPGAIAIHGDDGPALGSWGELLVSSLLIKRHGFDARSALAWARMAHPPVTPRVLSFSLAPKPAPPPVAAGRPHCGGRRLSAPAALPCPADVSSASVIASEARRQGAEASAPDCGGHPDCARAGVPSARRGAAPGPGRRGPGVLFECGQWVSSPDVFELAGLNQGLGAAENSLSPLQEMQSGHR
jgi:hypothetical protein